MTDVITVIGEQIIVISRPQSTQRSGRIIIPVLFTQVHVHVLLQLRKIQEHTSSTRAPFDRN